MPAIQPMNDTWTPDRLKQHRAWREKMFAPVKAEFKSTPKPVVTFEKKGPPKLNEITLNGEVSGRLMGVLLTEPVVSANLTIRDIQEAVCHAYKMNRRELLSPRRNVETVRPRQLAMFLCKRFTPRSLPDIGRHFGGKDHTTVLHAVRKLQPIWDQIEEKFAGRDLLGIIKLLDAAWHDQIAEREETNKARRLAEMRRNMAHAMQFRWNKDREEADA